MPAASSKYLILPSYSMEKRNPFTHHSLAVSFPGLANSTHTFAISNSVVLFGKDSFSSKLGRPLQPVKVGLDSVRQPLNPVNRIDLLVPQGDDGFRQALANAAQLSFSSSERPEPAPSSMAIKFPIVGKCDCRRLRRQLQPHHQPPRHCRHWGRASIVSRPRSASGPQPSKPSKWHRCHAQCTLL